MRISVPSKTFLIGEYAALEGSAALVLATQPRFVLSTDLSKGSTGFQPHPDSPAGRIWGKVTSPVIFQDPHSGAGGFGASGAEFLAARCFQEIPSVADLVTEYQRLQTGSGYDVAAQLLGGVAHICARTLTFQTLRWKLSGIDFLIFRTGQKALTHENLKLSKQTLAPLSLISENAVQAYVQGDMPGFIEGLSDFSSFLEIQGLVAKTTIEILGAMEMDSNILLAKGCGAMGADTVLALVQSDKASRVRQDWSKRLAFVASSQSLTEGLRVEPDPGASVEN